MKTSSLKSTITVMVVFLLFLFASSFSNDGSSNKYLTLWTMTNLGKMIIINEDGKTEEIKIEGIGGKDAISNPLKVTQTINNIANKGYELVSTSGDAYVVTYVFLKK